MLYSQYILKDNVFRLKNIEKQLRGTADLQIYCGKFYSICYDMLFACEEMSFNAGDYRYADIKDRIQRSMGAAKRAESLEDLRAAFTSVTDCFGDREDWSHMSVYDFNSRQRYAITSYNPISLPNMEQIISKIKAQNREIKIFDPRCRDGINLSRFASLGDVGLYGMEAETRLADQAKQRARKIAIGQLSGSRISNDVFDVMFIEAPISWEYSPSSFSNYFQKLEKLQFQNTIKYVRPGGIVIYLIPYYRLYRDMCSLFAKSLCNVQVRKLDLEDFYQKGLVAVIGNREDKKLPDEETYKMLRKLHDRSKIADFTSQPLNILDLPQGITEIEYFRGSVLDQEEIKNIISSSSAYGAFWDSQNVEKISENTKQPMLPFNIGQIGLVLTSGVLDGIVDEGDNCCHIIKGRVSKKTDTERSIVDGNIEVHETITNRVEINVFLPNGEYRVLA